MKWSKKQALRKLHIRQGTFGVGRSTHDYVMLHGYAIARSIYVNPSSDIPAAAGFHEMGHVLLGHTYGPRMHIVPQVTRHLHELEATAVEIICLREIGGTGLDHARQYYSEHRKKYKHLAGCNELPADFKDRVNVAARRIIEAGRVEE